MRTSEYKLTEAEIQKLQIIRRKIEELLDNSEAYKEIPCPKCNQKTKRNGSVNSTQRMRCTVCGHAFSINRREVLIKKMHLINAMLICTSIKEISLAIERPERTTYYMVNDILEKMKKKEDVYEIEKLAMYSAEWGIRL